MNLPSYKSNDELPLAMNAKDVAGYLNVSLTCAYNIMNSKDFPVLRVGRRLLVTRTKFLEWLDFVILFENRTCSIFIAATGGV